LRYATISACSPAVELAPQYGLLMPFDSTNDLSVTRTMVVSIAVFTWWKYCSVFRLPIVRARLLSTMDLITFLMCKSMLGIPFLFVRTFDSSVGNSLFITHLITCSAVTSSSLLHLLLSKLSAKLRGILTVSSSSAAKFANVTMATWPFGSDTVPKSILVMMPLIKSFTCFVLSIIESPTSTKKITSASAFGHFKHTIFAKVAAALSSSSLSSVASHGMPN